MAVAAAIATMPIPAKGAATAAAHEREPAEVVEQRLVPVEAAAPPRLVPSVAVRLGRLTGRVSVQKVAGCCRQASFPNLAQGVRAGRFKPIGSRPCVH